MNYISKQLYSIKDNGVIIRIRCHYNIETDHNTISTEFNKKYINNKRSKVLYCITQENITIQCSCIYNIKTDHITIITGIYKNGGEYNGSVNNKSCPTYFGVTVAEQNLLKIFNSTKQMPFNNPGFDFICDNDYKIDVKSSTLVGNGNGWAFHINKNKTADYFLCVAFDNRNDLNPEHIWLIPGHILNNKTGVTITKSTLQKWSEYELIDKLNDMKHIMRLL